MFLTKHCFENTIKKIGHHARKGDMMDQSYQIYACSGAYRARCFIGNVIFR